jgi:tellurite resistance protein TerC
MRLLIVGLLPYFLAASQPSRHDVEVRLTNISRVKISPSLHHQAPRIRGALHSLDNDDEGSLRIRPSTHSHFAPWYKTSVWEVNYRLKAFEQIVTSRKLGPHKELGHKKVYKFQDQGERYAARLAAAEWSFCILSLVFLLLLDVVVLQNLPETQRTHVTLLGFWLLVAFIYSMEVSLCSGTASAVNWMTGYIMELIYSADNVFVISMIFSSLETPHRLMGKALFIGMLCSIISRFALFMGIVPALPTYFSMFSWFLGTCLVYAGVSQLMALSHDGISVTETKVVGLLRTFLGDRLAEFYDEDGEAIFVVSKDKYSVTLLGVVLLCLCSANSLLGLDVALTKAEQLPELCLNFSSSALSVFAIRSLFIVARDVFSQFSLTSYGVGLVLILMGLEALIAPRVYVNAILSFLVIASIIAGTFCASSFKGQWSKASSPSLA